MKKKAPKPGTTDAESVATAALAEEPCMHRLIFSATEKGGVGKSFVNAHLADWYDAHPRRPDWQAFDPDMVNQSLSRFQPNGTTLLDVENDATALDNVVRVLAEKKDISLVDGVGALYERVFLRWAREISLFTLAKEYGIAITYILIIEETLETVEQGARLMEQVGDQVDWLIVRNLKQSRALTLWDKSREREIAMQMGAKEITLEKIPEHLAAFATKHSLTLQRAAAHEDCNMFDQRRYTTHWHDLQQAFQSAESVLFPAVLATEREAQA